MQVQSAYASGMQGLQSAQQGLAQATTAVAIPDQQKPAVSASTQDTVTLSSQAVSQSDQTSALIDATQSVNQAQASTKVIEAASETVGSLIDIEV
ncbi:chemotaxis protein [Shewanella saliphila]|uniref:Chemotaxis protein n=1 Tax=Shewanella saliphila TaxID=2282698 RepID=A0ABQ2Q0G0_9GAMM|nr:chemotaxis protein [Shewanella saliphila]MCL1100271.1 chemotaxis protein [Shewanella saliphila]GGP38205.1 chemotaxis protein [Shewanella saliphila]